MSSQNRWSKFPNEHFTVKNFALISVVCLTMAPALAFAQSAPKLPMVHRMSAFASWTVTHEYKDSSGKSQTPPSAIQSLTVTKTDKTYWLQTLLASGKKTETWVFDGTQLQSTPDGVSIYLVPAPTKESPQPLYVDYSKNEFEELEWLSPSNYKGIDTYQGKPIYRFEMAKSGAHLTALLSVDSQLPLYFSDGQETYVYSYNPPPVALLTPPRRFLDVLATHKRGVEALKYHPSSP